MKTRTQKSGDSLAVRIPKSFAAEVKLSAGDSVELSIVEGKLIVEPVIAQTLALEELLRGITDENLHGERDTGPVVGTEAW